MKQKKFYIKPKAIVVTTNQPLLETISGNNQGWGDDNGGRNTNAKYYKAETLDGVEEIELKYNW